MNWLAAWLVPALLMALGWVTGFGPTGAIWATPCAWLVFLLLVVVSATDLAARRIPNWATYSAMGWGLMAQLVLAVWGPWLPEHRFGFPSAMASCAGFAVGFVVFLFLYATMGGGAGDVKLAGALGLFLGPAALGEVLFGACISAGLAGAIYVSKQILLPENRNSGTLRQRLAVAMRGKLPMAPFFLGGLLLHWTPGLKGWLYPSGS